jgi:hypothetical protein
VGPGTCLDDVERKIILPVPGLELRPLGRRYTDCAIPAHTVTCPFCARFEILRAMTKMSKVLWVIMPYSSATPRRFGTTYHLHLHDRKIQR